MMYTKEKTDLPKITTAFVFSPPSEHHIGTLANYLTIFEKYNVNLKHLESRPSKDDPKRCEFLVECDIAGDVESALTEIKKYAEEVHEVVAKDNVRWFPRTIKEIGNFEPYVLSYRIELDADHPGFTDPAYRARRKYFLDISLDYKLGEPLPEFEYTKEETETWGNIYRGLKALHPTHACKEYRYAFALFEQNCGYSEDKIPNMQVVSDYLKDCTGFVLCPAGGLVSSRDFLTGLAFRIYYATTYIRHSSCPYYSPEPDICHELLGHIPMFSNSSFAEFAQEIGLASFGVSDEYINKLLNIIWFTLEYGMCRENGKPRAYGAGLLSSYGELQRCLEDKIEIRSFDPVLVADEEYPITEYQPVYYISDTIEEVKEKIVKFASTFPRPFGIRYDPYTQRVIVLESKDIIQKLIENVIQELQMLSNTLKKLK